MEHYDGLESSHGIHTKLVKLQIGEFRGSFTQKESGWFKGYNALEFYPSLYSKNDIAEWVKTDCIIGRDEATDYWYVTLANAPQGYILDDNEFMSIITGIEIINFEPINF